MKRLLLLIALVASYTSAVPAAPIAWPVRVSPNGRYFVDQKGEPVFWLGTTQWELFRGYKLQDAQLILDKSKDKGFVFVQTMLTGVGEGTRASVYGQKPWLNDDPLTPNEAYFKNVDAVIQAARERDMILYVLLYHQTCRKHITIDNARVWAKWLAQRYKETPNIIWSMAPEAKPEFVPILRELAAGLREGDGGAHLITVEPDPCPYSSSFIHEEPWLDFNSVQTWKYVELIYPMVTHDYDLKPVKPVLMAEGAYEQGSEYSFDVTPLWVRRQAYYSYLAGGHHAYGHNDSWRILPAWKQALDAPGARQMGILRRVFEARSQWWLLTPDQSLFAGGGQTKGQVLHRAARHPEGRWAVVYLADPAEFSVNLAGLQGPGINASWVNPATGESVASGSYANAGVQSFKTPAGWEDALLILEPPRTTGQASVERSGGDWLVQPVTQRVAVERSADGKDLVLGNGLIRRTFRLQPNAATVAYDNLMTGASILRGVKPEAMVQIDGRRFDIGGLRGQVEYAYLRPEWVDTLTGDPNAFQFAGYEVGETKARFPWARKRYAADLPWPPRGASLKLRFEPPAGVLQGVAVTVCYEMYQGIPLLAKWLEIHNGGAQTVRLNAFTSEILAAIESESLVNEPNRWELPNLHVESDYAFHGDDPRTADHTTHWVPDPQYTTQVNYVRRTPVLLESRPPLGPDVLLEPGRTFVSFRTFELIHDSTERERRGLAVRRMYRMLAPWVTENPILMHVRRADPEAVRLAVDQCAAVGFEMVIMTFGSGLNMENTDPAYMDKIKELVDYAHRKGVELGGYSLLASRRINDQQDVINPKTGRTGGAIFDNSPCLCSEWGRQYFRRLRTFVEHTGLDIIENDGSYPGDLCASTSHPGHQGLNDSQWRQWEAIRDFYQWCCGRGVYLNVPDWYFLTGSTKSAMGYREVNWSLPRERQIILGRQNLFDGTWWKTPSMGWMFVPLTEYHGGGAAATLEPLGAHLDAYEAHLAQNFGAGVQACYRGPRLYDTDETKAVVRKWVDFYKRYRPILDSDIIHVRRPDGRDIDCILHVNPQLQTRALAMIYNPLDQPVRREVKLPLYYTGLTATAQIREQEGRPQRYQLDRQYNITVPVTIPALSHTWLLVEAADNGGI